jgi:DNA mismatch repair protein MutS
MIQYYELKEKYPDSILFFRMGDFYEMFDDDAHIAHKVLGINITTRNKNAAEPIPLAGIPYHAKDKYLPILVKAGYKVAIAEQVSDPKLKGIVKREVVRVVTPSTLNLEGESYSNDEATNYIVSICEEN